MATVKLYLDQRRPKKDGTCPIKLNIHHFGNIIVSTGIDVIPDEWNGSEVTKGDKSYRQKNVSLRSIINRVDTLLLNLETTGEIHHMTDQHLKKRINASLAARNGVQKVFSDYIEDFIRTKDKANTKRIYALTLDRLKDYDAGCTFETMNKRWLTQFVQRMKEDGLATNTICIHLRNIRAVFNYAIDNEYTNLYPFRGFKIKKEATRKRNLSVDQLRQLRDYPCEPHHKLYRDIFMLMFYLIGINSIDLFEATPDQIVNGRLEYERSKTGKPYSIFIQPEAMEIIERYRGKKYLLSIRDRYEDYRDFVHHMNKELGEIGTMKRVGRGGKKVYEPIFPELTTYWARHTWATIAANLDIPFETISAALGHSYGSSTTNIYIDFNQKKVDEANRKVIDYVNEAL